MSSRPRRRRCVFLLGPFLLVTVFGLIGPGCRALHKPGERSGRLSAPRMASDRSAAIPCLISPGGTPGRYESRQGDLGAHSCPQSADD